MTETRARYTIRQMRLDEPPQLADRILLALSDHRGKGHEITSRDLAAKVRANWGVTRNCIHDMRATGHWIAANRKGYFMATSAAEMQETWDMIQHQAEAQHGTVGDLKRTAQAQFSGQQPLSNPMEGEVE